MPTNPTTPERFAPAPLAAPDPDRLPAKANVFERMRTANSKLTPMFSDLLGKGCLVPAVACFTGAPGRTFPMFKHGNCVDEIGMVFGAQGIPLAAGMVIQGAQEHFVNIPFENPNDPDAYTLYVVVQRQWEKDAPQRESVQLLCEQCQEPLITLDYVCDPEPAALDAIAARGDYVPFATLVEGARVAAMLNADAHKRVCTECGHVNRPFPIEDWGWHWYAESARTVTAALRAYPNAPIPSE